MNRYLIATLMIGLLACSCGKKTTETPDVPISPSNIVKLIGPKADYVAMYGTNVKIEYALPQGADSVAIWVDKIRQPKIDTSLRVYDYNPAAIRRVGTIVFKITGYRGDYSQSAVGTFTFQPTTKPVAKTIKIVKTFPHKSDAYTQGLLIKDGVFYESTGEYGASSLRKVKIESGEVLQQISLPSKYFGEGLTLINGKLYQITWQEQEGFIYNPDDLSQVGQFKYAGDGWGLTSDDKYIYKTNRSSTISVHDPNSFEIIRTIDVMDDRGSVLFLNEMEWIDGKIWANVYLSDRVVIINPETGMVETNIDCSILKTKIGNAETADVLNGIAQDPATKKIYMTGKLWDRMFEVSVQ